MWDKKESKAIGKEKFKANYWKCVLAALILTICTGAGSIIASKGSGGENTDTSLITTNPAESPPEEITDIVNMVDPSAAPLGLAALIGAAVLITGLICFAVRILVFNPLSVGAYGFFRDNLEKDGMNLGILKYGFSDYKRVVITLLLRDVYVFLWTLLLIFPGVIKSYSYRMVPFILIDNPELSGNEVITKSRKMMDGQKWNLFVFDLSYIGWFILGGLTLGLLNVFWTNPYRQSANADIYLRLSQKNAAHQEP